MTITRLVTFSLFAIPGVLHGGLSSSVLLTSSANPAVLGSPVSLTTTVSPSAATGKVTFYDGVTVLGTEPLTGGQAVLTTRLLPAGSQPVYAYYLGDTTYNAAKSTAIVQVVNALPAGGFQPPLVSSGDSLAVSMAVADFDSDGKADLVTGDGSAGPVKVFRGNGDGTFQAPASYAAGGSFVVTGDFNGDGKTDIAATNGSGSLGILLGNGNGTFQTALTYMTNTPFSLQLAVADFNGDGNADLAVSTESNVVVVLLGKGDGSFQPPQSVPAGFVTGPLAAGDFNGDGKTDIVVSALDAGPCKEEGCVTGVNVLLGAGDGTFGPPLENALSQHADSIVVGDFDADGKMDFALGGKLFSFAGEPFDMYFNVFLGNGDGTVRSASGADLGQITMGPESTRVVVSLGDINGDGKADLVFAADTSVPGSGIAATYILLGDGKGGFQEQPAVPLSAVVNTKAIGDFNGDGITDLAIFEQNSQLVVLSGASIGPSTIALSSSQNPVLLGTSVTLSATVFPSTATGTVTFYDGSTAIASGTLTGGTFSATVSFSAVGTHPLTAVYSGDATHLTSTSSVLNEVVFVVAVTNTTLSSSQNPAPSLEFITLTSTVTPSAATGTVTFYDGSTSIGKGTLSGGTASIALTSLAVGTHSLTAVYSGDATDASSTSPILSQVIFARTGSGVSLSSSQNSVALGSAVKLTANVSPSVATGKVTFYDGVTLLGTEPLTGGQAVLTTTLLAAGSQSLYAYYLGDATYGPAKSAALTQVVKALPASGFQPAVVSAGDSLAFSTAMADFDGDGKADLVTGDSSGGKVHVFPGNGDGTFKAPATYATGSVNSTNGRYVATGDFNGDGRTDIAVTDGSENGVSILLGNGDGTFQPPATYLVDALGAFNLVVGDFNGDGNADLAVGSGPSLVVILLGKGDGGFQPPQAFSIGNSGDTARGLATGDFNGDGKTDLAVVDVTNFECSPREVCAGVSVFLGGGDGTFGSARFNQTTVYPYTVAVGDFNGDGKMDLAVGGEGRDPLGNPVTLAVSVLPGSGDGNFPSQTFYNLGPATNMGSLPSRLAAVSVGDMNGDGNADLVVSELGGASEYVLLGDGTAAFQIQSPVQLSAAQGTTTLGDFNGDGITDLAIFEQSNDLVVLPGASTAVVHTSTTLSSSENPAAAGDTVTLTAMVSPSTATGSVAFFDGAVKIGSATLSNAAGGTVSVSVSSLAVGTHSLRAAYSGDGTHNPSTSPVLTEIVQSKVATTVTLISSSNPVSSGGSISLTALVSPSLATGAVIFYDGTTAIAAGALKGGTVSVSVSFSAVGKHPLKALYAGDSTHSPGISAVLNELVIAPIATTTTLSSSQNPAPVNVFITITAAIAPRSATGTVAFYNGPNIMSTVAVKDGSASATVSFSAAGTYRLTAVYNGDSTHSSSTSAVLNEVASAHVATSTALSSSQNPAASRDDITLTATVSPSGVTGLVTFYDGSIRLGASALDGGTAAWIVRSPTVGTHLFTAIYNGDAGHNPNTSPVLTQVVLAELTPGPPLPNPLTPNLLVDPGAENGLSGWWPSFPVSTTASPGHTGNSSFEGKQVPDAFITQTIPLTQVAGITTDLVDSGNLRANYSLWFADLNPGSGSYGQITLTFLDANNVFLGQGISDPLQDAGTLTWINGTGSFPIPRGTRIINYTMDFQTIASANTGLIDDNLLTISLITH